eukprot:SAG11_NODE_1518_length_4761_cov_2.905405_5_plen_105_part_00
MMDSTLACSGLLPPFLSRVHSVCVQDVTLIDTPGILSGKKQTHGRQYDFQTVVNWYAARENSIGAPSDCSEQSRAMWRRLSPLCMQWRFNAAVVCSLGLRTEQT